MNGRNMEDFYKFFKIKECFDCKEKIKPKEQQHLINIIDGTVKPINVFECPKCKDTYIIQEDGRLKRWNL